MSTYKRTGLNGVDYAVPSKPVLPPPPPPKPPVPPCPPPPPIDWGGYPFYPPYPEWDIEPVPTPPIPGRPGPGPIPPCPPPPHPHPIPPCPPPIPPYPVPPKPEKVDECSKRLAKLTQKTKVLVQMIKDFEQKNKPAILTVGNNSYQFGTEMITDFSGDPAKGMYAELICGNPIEALDPADYVVDDTNTRVALKNPVDFLQSELARVRKEIELVTAALYDEVSGDTPTPNADIPGTDEH